MKNKVLRLAAALLGAMTDWEKASRSLERICAAQAR
jgi:hypothetical protein